MSSKQVRLLGMFFLTTSFFVVEVVVSRITGSLAMLSDSFHMLSDVIALLVGLVAVRLAARTASTNSNTFGWIRAEVIGALVNAVFLTALCFTILLEAIERYMEPQQIEKLHVVLWVGVAGLIVNVLGLLLFCGYAKQGHSHSTSDRSSEKSHTSARDTGRDDHVDPDKADIVSKHSLKISSNGKISPKKAKHNSSSQLNMHGVFLHVLGDAFGSIIVVINALIFKYVWKSCDNQEQCINPCSNSPDQRPVNTDLIHSNSTSAVSVAGPCWVLYMDPTLCIIMVVILLCTTFPLLKESTLILLQSVPKQIDIQKLHKKLRSLNGVLAVHELHIWQLAGSRIIATAHVKCQDPISYMDTAKCIKTFFHEQGIHATTIQPEFSNYEKPVVSECELPCDSQCNLMLCCDTNQKPQSELVLMCTDDISNQTTPQESTSSLDIQQNLVVWESTI
ncbi:Zinc transporter 1 [Bagarius yarrelli]|uniref:Zinc transporter 1 n=1 Tax=Bagarius yarrelli TaxID=175774 RepID=A0A556U7L2_BAGYA|nr:Zinc transporter 1 [Bagarius yarrelli]